MIDCAVEENPWEPVDYLQELKDLESICSEVMEMLEWEATTEPGKVWAHHLPRILDQLQFFRGLAQDEIEHYGEYRYHDLQIDEVVEFIDEDLGELGDWICRMMGTQLPQDDDA